MTTTEMLSFKLYTEGDFFSDSYRVRIYTQISSSILNPKSNVNLNLMVTFQIAIVYFISFAEKKFKKYATSLN